MSTHIAEKRKMKQRRIPSAQYNSGFDTALSGLYERQLAQKRQAEARAEEKRRQNELAKVAAEGAELTFRPRLGDVSAVQGSFLERQEAFQLKKDHNLAQKRAEAEAEALAGGFKPGISDASRYIVERKRREAGVQDPVVQQIREQQALERTRRGEMPEKQPFQPKITEFAEGVQFKEPFEERLQTRGAYRKEGSGSAVIQEEEKCIPGVQYLTSEELQALKTSDWALQQARAELQSNYYKYRTPTGQSQRRRGTEKLRVEEHSQELSKNSQSRRMQELLESRRVRVAQRALAEQQNASGVERSGEKAPAFAPEINEISREIAARRFPESFEARQRVFQERKERRIQIQKGLKEAEEIKECTFRPGITVQFGYEGPFEVEDREEEFMARQEKALARRTQFERALQQKKQQQEADSIKYVLEHCGRFKAAPVPDYGIKLFDNDQATKQQIGTLLETGDHAVAHELRRVGGGDIVVGSITVDSVDKFVRRVREGRTQRAYELQ